MINFIVILCLFSPIATDMLSLNGLSRQTYTKTIYVDDVPGSGPDNPQEDYTSIQDAINAAYPFDNIYVYNGTYSDKRYFFHTYYKVNVAINKPLTLIGENQNSTIIDGLGSRILEICCSDVTIKGFTLENSGNGGWFDDAIVFYRNHQIADINISHCIIRNGGNGISFMDDVKAENISIYNCQIYNNSDTSIRFSNGTNNFSIKKCLIEHNGKYLGGNWYKMGGIELLFWENSSNIEVSNCKIRDNYFSGLEITTRYGKSANNVKVFNNEISDKSIYGIWISIDGSSCSISNNTIKNHSSCGIRVSELHMKDCQFVNNTISSNGKYGIRMWDSNDSIFNNNRIVKNGDDGFHITKSFNNNMYNNNISNNDGNGIYLYLNDNNTISNCFLTCNNLTGISIRHSNNNRLIENKINNNEVGIELAVANKNNISSNEITNHSEQEGIKFGYSCDNNIVAQNLVSDNFYGIEVYESSNNSYCQNILSNNKIGLSLLYSPHNLFQENKVLVNDVGLYVTDHSKDNLIKCNIFDNNKRGILFNNSMENKIINNDFYNNEIMASFNLWWGAFRAYDKNIWAENYWNRPRFLPYLISGQMNINQRKFKWFNYDLQPKIIPNDIE